MTASHPQAPPGANGSVWTYAGMPALGLLSVFGFSGYAALLSVAPLWAVRGGADAAGSGLVNGVLLAATVATQFGVPALLRRFGHGPVIAVGVVLLGAASPLYLLSDDLLPVLALSAVRGAGFGILTVTGSAVAAHLVPAHRRGAAIGAYGLAVAVPNLLLLPLSVAIADRWGFAWVFALGALPLVATPFAFAVARALGPLDRVAERAPRLDRAGVVAIARPTGMLFAVTMAGGGLLTFAPQIVRSGTGSALVLLVLGVGTAGCRWGAGHLSDRYGAQRFLAPLLLVGALGLATCAWGASRGGDLGLLVAGAALVGIAYGALQNLTLVVAFEQVDPAHIPVASAGWNIGFDGGTAAGAVLVGAIATGAGFSAGLLVLAAVCVAALVLTVPRR
ncbi:MFS transporter [Pedococcus sp. KACC 23699]|uniref:MFS transporter n=1 Tax=Pedococcus sp. KACC 23699 TaxID=3149228 RepID=A0AAU7JRN5_9MICO